MCTVSIHPIRIGCVSNTKLLISISISSLVCLLCIALEPYRFSHVDAFDFSGFFMPMFRYLFIFFFILLACLFVCFILQSICGLYRDICLFSVALLAVIVAIQTKLTDQMQNSICLRCVKINETMYNGMFVRRKNCCNFSLLSSSYLEFLIFHYHEINYFGKP